MKLTYELWRLVAVKDESRSTGSWSDDSPTSGERSARIHELAGRSIVSPEEGLYWYEDQEGTHTFRIEAVRLEE